jgi:multidrug resistance protein
MPALNDLTEEMDVTPAEINLTVTTYMVFQGLSPFLVSGFTDALGRRPAYIACMTVYIAANIALALARRYVHMLAIRCLQSAGSSIIMVVAQAAVTDIVTSAERGSYISLTTIPQLVGPSLGPVVGGVLTKFQGWRSIFWFLTIFAAVELALLIAFLPETHRKVVGNGSALPPRLYRTLLQCFGSRYKQPSQTLVPLQEQESAKHSKKSTARIAVGRLISPLTLLRDIEFCLLIFCGGILFAGIFAMVTAAPSMYASIYGLDDLQVGLMYLPMTGGSVIAVAIIGPLMNWNYRRHAQRLGLSVDKDKEVDLVTLPIERQRLEIAIIPLILGIGVLFSWGWVAETRGGVGPTCVLIFFIGVCLSGVQNSIQALIIDMFPNRAGAALAAYNLSKCGFGAVGSSVIDPMIGSLGLVGAFSVFGGLFVLIGPILAIVMWKGSQWRKRRREKETKEKKAPGQPQMKW